MTEASSLRSGRRIVLYDTTLRDGAQTKGVDFSTLDKQLIAEELDRLGVDYIEAGWPGANPTDDAFFADPPHLGHARLTAFGTTRRPGRSASNDPGLGAVLKAGTQAICLVGKASDIAAEIALGVTPAENLDLIGSAIAEVAAAGREVLFDAEHFFDGFLHNPDYALSCLRCAEKAGAAWLVLCDTNGGTLPEQIFSIVGKVVAALPDTAIGIHTHNDTDTAVAGSLAAVAAGATMIQGTLNGLGERCGNANLTALIPNLMLKLGHSTGVSEDGLRRLTQISRSLDERLNRASNPYTAYVGENAFAHKAGLHAAAIIRDSSSYEHVPPERVGNQRQILVSNQAGRSNLLNRLEEFGFAVNGDDPRLISLVEQIKLREFQGWSFENAEASFALFARRVMQKLPDLFSIISLGTTEARSWSGLSQLSTHCSATVEVKIGGDLRHAHVVEKDVLTAVDAALRAALRPIFPEIVNMRIQNYRTRILTRRKGDKQAVRVILDSYDANIPALGCWSTMGVSEDIAEASLIALQDAITYRLLYREQASLKQAS